LVYFWVSVVRDNGRAKAARQQAAARRYHENASFISNSSAPLTKQERLVVPCATLQILSV
jgi:hypothetical protein